MLNDVEVGSTIYRHVVDHSTAAKKDRLLLNLRVRRQRRTPAADAVPGALAISTSNGDHVDPFGPKTHFFQFDKEPRLSAASSLLDQLAGRPTPYGTPRTTFVPGWAASTRARRPIPQRAYLSRPLLADA